MIRLAALLHFICIGLVVTDQAFAILQCADIFTSTRVSSEAQISIDKAIESLAQMRIHIDQEKTKGANSIVLPTLIANFKKKEKEIQEYLEKYGIMTVLELNERIKQQIFRQQNPSKEIEKKEEAELDARRIADSHSTVEAFHHREQAVFNRVEPGEFLMGKPGFVFFDKRRKVTVTKPFEMMSTPVTQALWHKVLNLSMDLHKTTYLGWVRAEGESHFKGDSLPVESVHHRDANRWILELNVLSKFGHPELAGLIVGHKKGDFYRLPTEAEWEFVASNRGQFTPENHPFGKKSKNIADYAWTAKNSEGHTHPVATKKPLIVDGKKFYDLFGNVREWVQDMYVENLSRKAAIDPIVDPKNYDNDSKGRIQTRVIKSGGYRNSTKDIRSDSRYPEFFIDASEDLGFRLVREVRP